MLRYSSCALDDADILIDDAYLSMQVGRRARSPVRLRLESSRSLVVQQTSRNLCLVERVTDHFSPSSSVLYLHPAVFKTCGSHDFLQISVPGVLRSSSLSLSLSLWPCVVHFSACLAIRSSFLPVCVQAGFQFLPLHALAM